METHHTHNRNVSTQNDAKAGVHTQNGKTNNNVKNGNNNNDKKAQNLCDRDEFQTSIMLGRQKCIEALCLMLL